MAQEYGTWQETLDTLSRLLSAIGCAGCRGEAGERETAEEEEEEEASVGGVGRAGTGRDHRTRERGVQVCRGGAVWSVRKRAMRDLMLEGWRKGIAEWSSGVSCRVLPCARDAHVDPRSLWSLFSIDLRACTLTLSLFPHAPQHPRRTLSFPSLSLSFAGCTLDRKSANSAGTNNNRDNRYTASTFFHFAKALDHTVFIKRCSASQVDHVVDIMQQIVRRTWSAAHARRGQANNRDGS